MDEEPKPDYFLVPDKPGPCPLCDAVVPRHIYYGRDTGAPSANSAVDCGTCGTFGITVTADVKLKARPNARSGIREQLKMARSRGERRPLIEAAMIDFFAGSRQPS